MRGNGIEKYSMPSPVTAHLPRPKSWDEFEDICVDLLKKVWKDSYIVRYGRSGQKQHGVDIYGFPEHLGGYKSQKIAGAQCKDIETLTISIIESEVKKAINFEPPLTEYLILTTAKRDAALQDNIRNNRYGFRIHIMFWDDISLEISGYDDLLKKHFPHWSKKTTSRNEVIDLVYLANSEDFDYDDSTGVYIYTHDIQLRLVQDRKTWFADDGGRGFDQFEEDWVKRFPNHHAYRQLIYIEYGGTRIETIRTTLVDGGRYFIPYPKSFQELIITKFQYKIGQILNRSQTGVESFDFGLNIAGITVED